MCLLPLNSALLVAAVSIACQGKLSENSDSAIATCMIKLPLVATAAVVVLRQALRHSSPEEHSVFKDASKFATLRKSSNSCSRSTAVSGARVAAVERGSIAANRAARA